MTRVSYNGEDIDFAHAAAQMDPGLREIVGRRTRRMHRAGIDRRLRRRPSRGLRRGFLRPLILTVVASATGRVGISARISKINHKCRGTGDRPAALFDQHVPIIPPHVPPQTNSAPSADQTAARMSAASREALHEVVAGSLLSRHSGVASRRKFRRTVSERTGKARGAARLPARQTTGSTRSIKARERDATRHACARSTPQPMQQANFVDLWKAQGQGPTSGNDMRRALGGAIDTSRPAAALPPRPPSLTMRACIRCRGGRTERRFRCQTTYGRSASNPP